jgi:hypothetical protein
VKRVSILLTCALAIPSRFFKGPAGLPQTPASVVAASSVQIPPAFAMQETGFPSFLAGFSTMNAD